MRSHEDVSDEDILEVIDRDVSAEVELAEDSQATGQFHRASGDIDLPIDLDEPRRLPKPTPPPRSSRRAIASAALTASPPKLVDPVVAVRDPVGPSLVPVALSSGDILSEELLSDTKRIPRARVSTLRRPSHPQLAWAAVWIFFGALGSMSLAYLLGYVPGTDAAPPVAAPVKAAKPPPAIDETVALPPTKREANVVSFGDDQAMVFGATPTATATATAAPTAAPTTASAATAATAKKHDKAMALLGPTLDTPKPEPVKAKVEAKKPPPAEPKHKDKEPAPGSVEALMEAQLKAAAR